MLIAAFGISAAICAPTLATLGSRIDRRVLLTGSMAICALANVLAALSRDYDQLMLARVLAAVTSAVYTPQVAATVSMLVPESERGPTLAKLMIGWAVGSVLGNPLSVLIASMFELAHVVCVHRSRQRRRCAARVALGARERARAAAQLASLVRGAALTGAALAHRRDGAHERRRQRHVELHRADREGGAGDQRSGARGAAVHLGRRRPVGQSAERAVDSPRRRDERGLQVQRNIRRRHGALAVLRHVDCCDLRRAVRVEPRQRRLPGRAAGAAGRRRADARSGDDRAEFIDDLSRRVDRRHDRRERVDTWSRRASCRGWGWCSCSRRSGARCSASARRGREERSQAKA